MATVVLYPSPGMGHLISMVELGKFMLSHHPTLSITILASTPPFINTGSTVSYIRHVSATTPAITFHHLPTASLPMDPHAYPSMEAIIFELLRVSNPRVQEALQSISQRKPISAFIIDFFCTSAYPIAAKLNIPTYYFFTSGAGCLALFAYMPTIHKNTTESFKDLNQLLHVPGLPQIPSSDMPVPVLDRNSRDYADFLDFSYHIPKLAGLIINTFESLEPKAFEALSEGKCFPDSPTKPPVYCIGPLIASNKNQRNGDAASGTGKHECLEWLDTQPKRSVVFLCFGSLGLFSAEQIKEIAVGLEKSDQRFLWVLRSPPSEDKSKRFLPPPEPELDLLLPGGFLDRTKDRGLVLKSWAPQVDVLSHESVGGFVTHCGWNSVLEAVCAGVPMVAWPLYAEQRFNKVLLVEDLKLALPMEESENGFVTASEVEKRVREVMESESEEGKVVKEQARAKKEEAVAAMSEGGSSLLALAKLIGSWKAGTN